MTLAIVAPAPSQGAGAAPDLTLRGVSAGYPGAAPALRGVDLALAPGERAALIGPNGAGKTTMLLAALRLIEPSAGEITLFGEPVTGARRRGLRRLRAGVGFVFQKHNLVARLSVLSNVIHGAMGRAGALAASQAIAPRALRDEAMAQLARVGLADFAGRRADRLSGGQAQRVAIARALMQRPRLMLADEPAASLDPQAGEEVMALLADLARADGIGLIFTSHNLGHARAHATRIVGLRAGRIAFDAPAAELDAAATEALYG